LGLDFNGRAFLRRDVVLAVNNGGHPDAIAKEYGVSRASVYNWTKDYRMQGANGLIHAKDDQRFTFSGQSVLETLRRVKAVILRNPEWSADKLASVYMSWGVVVSARTMRNIFKRLGVNTTEQRKEKSFKPDNFELSPAELLRVIEQIEQQEKMELAGRKPGNILLQDRVKFPVGFCHEQ